jgi:hypothetical protein
VKILSLKRERKKEGRKEGRKGRKRFLLAPSIPCG